MIYCPDKYIKPIENLSLELDALKGDLPDNLAKITLAKFLRYNLPFFVRVLTGINVTGPQLIMLKAFLISNFTMAVVSRGGAKSYTAALYMLLQCIMYPGTNIIIAGPTFRTARRIFEYMESMIKGPKAQMLMQCTGPSGAHRTDEWIWDINGGTIRAIPLNGEKLRGFRANVVIVDEFRLVSPQIVEDVLMPFLIVPQDGAKRLEIERQEDIRIAAGKMKESERTRFDNTNKMIALSSASYTFEHLYELYKKWIRVIQATPKEEQELISEGKNMNPGRYCVLQFGWKAIPKALIDDSIIAEASATSESGDNGSVMREYGAQFVDGNDSYYGMFKMNRCTVEDGNYPTTQIIGDREKKYIMSIDPCYGDADNSDYYAMSILLMDDETQIPTLVHSYAVAGGELENHHKYIVYLYKAFNPEMIIFDATGGSADFINGLNQAAIFKENDIQLKELEFDFGLEGIEYAQACIEAKAKYSKEGKIMCVPFIFGNHLVRRANDYMKNCIDYQKINFASKINAIDSELRRCIRICTPKEIKEGKGLINTKELCNKSIEDFIDFQDEWIYQTKKQCSLIVPTTTANGSITFDLPASMRKLDGKNKPRKDNYTCLLMANWCNRFYYDVTQSKHAVTENRFTPRLI